ncbi:uncharacterized protein LOC131605717 [Vicia villosa]|uniref:uncharacterized protein LOC131605717 n=1 Tax=Vicia villosa TaxID=3911 RepID=UPI00273BF982|nr:uncharacterized protein LOC131605717 [Vicia villosa]
MPLLLRDWKPGFSLKEDMLRTLPIWVKLPLLRLYQWGVRSLNKIGSALGNPLVTDECIASKARVSYARILVEVDVTQELKNMVTIKDAEGRKLKQSVEYEWKPLFCGKCQTFGHICKEKWQPKAPAPEEKKKPLTETDVAFNDVPETEEETPMTDKEDIRIKESGKEWETVLSGRHRGLCFLIVAWNVRGLNKAGKLREVSSCLKDIRPRITILLETRVKENKAKDIRQQLLAGGMFVDNYANHYNGRIWINWDNNRIDLQVRYSTNQLLHCVLYDLKGDFLYWITAICVANNIDERRR